MNFVSKIQENPLLIFQVILIALLILLAIVFVVVMCSENPEWSFKLFGVSGSENPKFEALKFLGIGMGGVLVALQALASHRRAKAMEDTAKTQVDAANAQADAANAQADAAKAQARANEHTEQGLRQERLKNAIEHLGHDSDSVRLGGAYELFHLARDIAELRQTVLDILCAHIRRTTGENEYRKNHKSKPSEEVQSLLTLLFVQNHEIFKGLRIELQGSWLNGADIREAHLEKAILTKAHLQGTILFKAHLQEANLREAHLQGANLEIADLQAADLVEAHLQGAELFRICLQAAYLFSTYLQGVRLVHANLQGAKLGGAQLQGADLSGAHLEGVNSMAGPDAFADRIRQAIDKETDLHGVVFAGGLSREDVDCLVEGLSNEKANELREKLEPHVGQPESNELPTGYIHVFTGTYTEEEAEEWIAEYEKAMSEVPEDDS